MALAIPPAPDELEVSLFGPGVGECVVAHAGCGEWIVVDSCINPDTRAPAALEYLQAIGVDASTAVKRVIVSHWHDDHTRGISRVFRAAAHATLVCSAALRRDEFQQFIAASRSLNMKVGGSSGVDEFTGCLEVVAQRRAGEPRAIVGPTWVQADTLVHHRQATAGDLGCQVFALSPSSETLTRGLHDIAELLPKPGAPKRAAVNVGPNDTSVVVTIRCGDAVAFLGSDLQNGTASTRTGWAAVLTTTALPTVRGQVFKVPHHGSENAYHPGQWSQLLGTNAIAVVTPYAAGRKALPSETDIQRLKAHTQHVYRTAPPPPKAGFADPAVQRTVSEAARSVRLRTSRLGHVRVRVQANGGAAKVELFGAASVA
jgi:beta-lactamase superfamily II metal-dependent hydrolase